MRLTLRIENQQALPNGQPLIQVLDRAGLQMGRAAYVDWQLPDPQKLISSEHAEVLFRDGGYVLRDKSKNGTYLNGARIDSANREARLNDGDRIAIGQYELSVRLAGDEPQLAAIEPEAPREDVWGKTDWGGAVPEPQAPEETRTPMNSRDSLSTAFRATGATATTASPSAWDNWGDGVTADGSPQETIQAPAPPPPVPAGPAISPADAARTSAGFLKGLSLSGDAAMDASAAEQAGRTMRVLVNGLYDLLKRHSEMKSVLGIERTAIRLADNNTFKFAASPEDALRRLMIPAEGDLPGPAAAQRSFDDVKRHEERLLTALNDAVRRIVERLSPQEIKRRETGGMMGKIIPGSSKAAWWDELEREHARLLEDNAAKLDELIEDELRSAFSRHL
jgi:type VI secretion system FHA domain protein